MSDYAEAFGVASHDTAAWPKIDEQLHNLGKSRIDRVIRICEELPHDHVTPELILAEGSRETLMQNVISGMPGWDNDDDDTGWTQLNRKVWVDMLKNLPGCKSGSWAISEGHSAAEPGYCPTFTDATRITVSVFIGHIHSAKIALPDASIKDIMRVVVASWNRGFSGALTDFRAHGDPDINTAQHNYSHDVLEVRRPQVKAWLVKHHYLEA